MAIGMVGQKIGMTRIFLDTGKSVPVSVIKVQPNRVIQKKTKDSDGYSAIQVTTGRVKASKVNKPLAGHYKKAGTEAGKGLWEFKIQDSEEQNFEVGNDIKVDFFQSGQKVDVTGVSKGKGFAGVHKRHNFKTQDATHGNSLSHRAPGSIGQNQTPGRVFKGKKMAGQLGNKKKTVQNLEIVRIDNDRQLILVKGAIPGAPGGDVIVKPAVKLGVQDAAGA